MNGLRKPTEAEKKENTKKLENSKFDEQEETHMTVRREESPGDVVRETSTNLLRDLVNPNQPLNPWWS